MSRFFAQSWRRSVMAEEPAVVRRDYHQHITGTTLAVKLGQRFADCRIVVLYCRSIDLLHSQIGRVLGQDRFGGPIISRLYLVITVSGSRRWSPIARQRF